MDFSGDLYRYRASGSLGSVVWSWAVVAVRSNITSYSEWWSRTRRCTGPGHVACFALLPCLWLSLIVLAAVQVSYMFGKRRVSVVGWLRGEIDLHVVAMLLLLAPAGCLGWWWLAVPLLLPQGRIGTRALVDYPAFGQRPWPYVVANELLVLSAVAMTAGMRVVVRAVA
jgi:hypothetical protein